MELTQKGADDPNQADNLFNADFKLVMSISDNHNIHNFEPRLIVGCLIPIYGSVRGGLVDIPSNDRKQRQ